MILDPGKMLICVFFFLQYVFDFNEGVGVTSGSGGNLTIANVVDFPYLFGKGMALSVGRMAYVSPYPLSIPPPPPSI